MLRITKTFEQTFVSTLVTDAQTLGLLLGHIEVDDFQLEQSRAIVKCLKMYWKKHNKPIKELSAFEQFMKSISDKGEVDLDKVYNARQFILTGKSEDPDSVRQEAAEAIRKSRKQELAENLVMSMDEDGATARAVSSLEQIDRIGHEDKEEGLELGDGMFEEISKLSRKNRCPTGIPDLDMKLRGGMAKGELLIFCAQSGGGKSLALAAMAATGIRNGHNVAFATLELASAYQGMRLLACLTGVPTNKLESNEGRKEAQSRFNQLKQQGIGSLHVKEFEPTLGTSQDIINWVTQLEEKTGKEIDLIVIDYLDKLGTTKVGGPNANSYQIQGQAAEDLRYFAMEGNKKWIATASQSKGREKKQVLGMSDIADSIGKVRVADLFITINKDKDSGDISLFVAKSRGGISDVLVGPYDPGFEYGALIQEQVGFPELRQSDVQVNRVKF